MKLNIKSLKGDVFPVMVEPGDCVLAIFNHR